MTKIKQVKIRSVLSLVSVMKQKRKYLMIFATWIVYKQTVTEQTAVLQIGILLKHLF